MVGGRLPCSEVDFLPDFGAYQELIHFFLFVYIFDFASVRCLPMLSDLRVTWNGN